MAVNNLAASTLSMSQSIETKSQQFKRLWEESEEAKTKFREEFLRENPLKKVHH